MGNYIKVGRRKLTDLEKDKINIYDENGNLISNPDAALYNKETGELITPEFYDSGEYTIGNDYVHLAPIEVINKPNWYDSDMFGFLLGKQRINNIRHYNPEKYDVLNNALQFANIAGAGAFERLSVSQNLGMLADYYENAKWNQLSDKDKANMIEFFKTGNRDFIPLKYRNDYYLPRPHNFMDSWFGNSGVIDDSEDPRLIFGANIIVDTAGPFTMMRVYNQALPIITNPKVQAFVHHPTYTSGYNGGKQILSTRLVENPRLNSSSTNSGIYFSPSREVAENMGMEVEQAFFPRPSIELVDIGANDYRMLSPRYVISESDPILASTVNDVTKKKLFTKQGINYTEIPDSDGMTLLVVEGNPVVDLSQLSNNKSLTFRNRMHRLNLSGTQVNRTPIGIADESLFLNQLLNNKFATTMSHFDIPVGVSENTFEGGKLFIVFDPSKIKFYNGFNLTPTTPQFGIPYIYNYN